MNSVIKRRVFNLIQFIFNNYVSEEHKSLLLFKYSSIDSFNSIIEEMIIDVYCTYAKDRGRLDFYLSFLADKYFNGKDINEIKRDILEKLEANLECSNYSLEENHNILSESLVFICRELNKRNVDYYVIGSIPIYLKLNRGFSRFHSDIDIAINSEDIHYLNDIFNDSDFVFCDNRYCSQKFFDYNEKRARGGHEIIAQNKKNDFSIGFFEFDRLDNGSIIKKDYFSEVVEGHLISRVCKFFYSKEFVNLYYSDDKLTYKDVDFRYCNVEGIYLLKKKNYVNIERAKDRYDVNFIEKYYELDESKIFRMCELLSEYVNYKIEEV